MIRRFFFFLSINMDIRLIVAIMFCVFMYFLWMFCSGCDQKGMKDPVMWFGNTGLGLTTA